MVGMEVEIRPGHLYKDQEDNIRCSPIKSRIVSLNAEKNNLLYAIPGGLIGVGLLVDPAITRNDRMVGNVLGQHGDMPPIYIEIDVQYHLMRKLLGMKKAGETKPTKVQKIVEGEVLKFNIGSTETPGKIMKVYDVIFYLILGYHQHQTEQSSLHQYWRKSCFQQKNRKELSTYWSWNNQACQGTACRRTMIKLVINYQFKSIIHYSIF